MGVIKQGILGGFSGKVANVVGSSWKGIAVIKSLPLSVANPRTASQVSNRNTFASVVAVASLILVTICKPLFDRIAVKMSGFNYFVQKNQSHFDATGIDEPEDIVISEGTVGGVEDFVATVVGASLDVSFAWTDNTGVGDSLSNDELYIMCYTNVNNQAVGFATGVLRSAESADITLPDGWDTGSNVECYSAFRRADGSRASNTAYSHASRE